MYGICLPALKGQKEESNPLELELQAVVNQLMWMLGTKLGKEHYVLLTTEA